VRVGQVEKARKVFGQMVAVADPRKARGYRSLALLDMYEGKYTSAAANLREAILLNQANKMGLSEFRDRLFRASVYRMLGRQRELAAELNTLSRLVAQTRLAPEWLSLAGAFFARNGRRRDAEGFVAQAAARMTDPAATSGVNRSNRGDEAELSLLKGEVALASDRAAEALETFELAHRLKPAGDTLEAVALANLRLGRTAEAIGRYEELLGRDELGGEGQEPWILAHYELGRLYEQTGDAAKARQRYERFLEIWKNADPEIRVVADARTRLAALAKRGG